MSATSPLLDLPSEIRNQIWKLLFENLYLAPAPLVLPCFEAPWRKRRDEPENFQDTVAAMRICKSIHKEVSGIFYPTLTLQLNVFPAWRAPEIIRQSLRSLTLDLYVQEDTRRKCFDILGTLDQEFHALRKLTLYSHLRPPMGYDELLDAAYLAGPLVTMRSGIQLDLHFEYLFEAVMFESPIIGDIRCSDALEEHELVIRDLFTDPSFVSAAIAQDFNSMCFALMQIARAHERPWFEKLQRRRLAQQEREEAEAAARERDGGLNPTSPSPDP